jgi:hypothetical protein
MHAARTTLTLAALLALGLSAAAREPLPAGLTITRLEAKPAAVTLKTPFDYTQLLVTGHTAAGEQIDVTRMVEVAAPAAVTVSPAGLIRPTADGRGEVKLTLNGQSLAVPVTVSGQKAAVAVSFVKDVQPVLSKLGCNQGTCHGAAQGKNGFKLSLRGYDPIYDYRALTDDLSGRRFNRAAPDRSLMLLKPAGAVPHVGGVLMQPGEPPYELLRQWIAQGVRLDLNAPRVSKIEVLPKGPVLPRIGLKQQTTVLATYADGSTRDVTAEAFIESSNTEVATVDKAGLVTSVRRGEATMLARYEGAYDASTLVVMGDRSGFAWAERPVYNVIDELVDEKLKQVKVQPSELCTDADFVRRLYLDLTGLPPEPEIVKAFLADARPSRQKRDELVDRLVGGEAYVEHWTNKWADLLQVNRKFLGEKGAAALRQHIRAAVATNQPYDKFVYEILTGSGSTVDNPAAAYYKVLRTPDAAMENTTQLFLAIRFNCNKCHDHPFEKWTQDQYYETASYFTQVTRKEDKKYAGQKVGGSAVEGAVPLVEVIADTGGGDIRHDRTGKPTPPKFPFTHPDLAPPTAPRRVQLAKWVTSPQNPYFAKSYVNRIWSYLLGVGIIEPVDDIRAGNPASNPKLLDRLTADFVAGGFDVQKLVKTICKSRTYQLSIETNRWNADDDLNYSHAVARRLPAEVLYDTIHAATGSKPRLPGLPAGARAAQLLDSNVELPGGFLSLFGKPVRESACECERSSGMMLGPVLAMVNGPVLADAVKDPSNRLAKLVAEQKDDARLVEELFVAVLCRKPTPAEAKAGVEALHAAGADRERLLTLNRQKAVALAAYEKQLDGRQPSWEAQASLPPAWTVLTPDKLEAKTATLTKQSDGSILATGKNQGPELYTITATVKLPSVTGIRLEALPDGSLPAKGPGRGPNGNFVLNELRLTAGSGKKSKPVGLHKATATFAQQDWAVAGAIDGNLATGWAVFPRFGEAHTAIFELKQPVAGGEKGTVLTFALDQRYPDKQHHLGKFRLSVTDSKNPSSTGSLPAEVVAALKVPAAQRTPAQAAALVAYHRSQDAEYRRLQAEAAQFPEPPSDPRLLGAQDLAWSLMNTPAFLFNH